jgi:hypothetical protein
MSPSTEFVRVTTSSFSAISDREALNVEALTCIITGRPLPEQLRPAEYVVAPVATAEEGLRRIIEGPSAG